MIDDLKNTLKQALNKQEKSFAVFDFDNTCIVNDIGEAVFGFVCKNKLLKDPTLLPNESGDYHERVFRHYYSLLNKKEMLAAYLLCAQAFSGFTLEDIEEITLQTLEAEGTKIGETSLYGIAIPKGLSTRPVAQELLTFLQKEGVEIWIISASPEIIVRSAMKHFGISTQLIGLRNTLNNGILTKEISKPYSIGEGKVTCIKTYIRTDARPLFGIGDSMNDFALIEYSTIRAIVNRTNGLTEEARKRNWFIL